MIIYDYKSKKEFNDIFIFLNKREMEVIIGKLQMLLDEPDIQHAHVSKVGKTKITKEMTFAIYTRENIKQFDKVSKALILRENDFDANNVI